jgi:hypothetical protein
VPKKKGKKPRGKPAAQSTVEVLLEQLTDPKIILVVAGAAMFVLYQRNQNKQLEMMLKIKELEV